MKIVKIFSKDARTKYNSSILFKSDKCICSYDQDDVDDPYDDNDEADAWEDGWNS